MGAQAVNQALLISLGVFGFALLHLDHACPSPEVTSSYELLPVDWSIKRILEV